VEEKPSPLLNTDFFKEVVMPRTNFKEIKRRVSMQMLLEYFDTLEDLEERGASLRGDCPFCESENTFSVSLSKNCFQCFNSDCKKKGNVLDYVIAHRGVSVRLAAELLEQWFPQSAEPRTLRHVAEFCKAAPKPPADVPHVAEAETTPRENKRLDWQGYEDLDPTHPFLSETCGIPHEVVERFSSGYCKKGIMRGRIAVPIYSRGEELLAYAGLAVEEGQTPEVKFPKNFFPELELYNIQNAETNYRRRPERPFLYLCTSFFDVWRLARHEQVNALALTTGEMSEEQGKRFRETFPTLRRLDLVMSASDPAVPSIMRELGTHVTLLHFADVEAVRQHPREAA
jgi:hypothetical protein